MDGAGLVGGIRFKTAMKGGTQRPGAAVPQRKKIGRKKAQPSGARQLAQRARRVFAEANIQKAQKGF